MFPDKEIFSAPVLDFFEGRFTKYFSEYQNSETFGTLKKSQTELLSLYPGIKSMQIIILLFLITANNSHYFRLS